VETNAFRRATRSETDGLGRRKGGDRENNKGGKLSKIVPAEGDRDPENIKVRFRADGTKGAGFSSQTLGPVPGKSNGESESRYRHSGPPQGGGV